MTENQAVCSCDPEAYEIGPEGQRRYFEDRYCPIHGQSAKAYRSRYESAFPSPVLERDTADFLRRTFGADVEAAQHEDPMTEEDWLYLARTVLHDISRKFTLAEEDCRLLRVENESLRRDARLWADETYDQSMAQRILERLDA